MGEETTQKPTAEDEVKHLQSTSGKQTFHVKIYSPFKTYYDGIAESLTAANDTGNFDILPRHKNFLTLLSACDIIIRADKEEKVTISQGIMLVKADEVTVFLDA